MASIIQFTMIDATSASNLSATFSSPVTPGNAIYCLGSCIVGAGLLETFTFTDNNGDTFQIIDTQFNLDATPMSHSVAFNVAGGTTTVNMALLYPGIGGNYVSQMIMVEIEGIFALDPGVYPHASHEIDANNAWGTPGTLQVFPPVTAALTNPFVLVAVQSVNNPPNIYTAGTGYTMVTQLDSPWGGTQDTCLGLQVGNFTDPGVYIATMTGSENPGGGTFVPYFGVNAVCIFATGSGSPPPPPSGGSTFSPCGKMPTLELTRDVDADWGDETTFFITQDQPFPFTLRGLVFRIPFNTD